MKEHMRAKSDEPQEIHLALSGGGYRAAAFCLVVVALLMDRNLWTEIRSITSVSGGTFLNLFIDQHLDLGSMEKQPAVR